MSNIETATLDSGRKRRTIREVITGKPKYTAVEALNRDPIQEAATETLQRMNGGPVNVERLTQQAFPDEGGLSVESTVGNFEKRSGAFNFIGKVLRGTALTLLSPIAATIYLSGRALTGIGIFSAAMGEWIFEIPILGWVPGIALMIAGMGTIAIGQYLSNTTREIYGFKRGASAEDIINHL